MPEFDIRLTFFPTKKNLVAFDKASAEGVLVSAVHDARAKRGWEAYEAAGKEIYHG